jgi:hypothetical protein
VDLKAVQVAHHQQRRILQRLPILQQLLVGGAQVLVLALVFPGEVAALPDIGEPAATADLLDALLEGVVGAGWVLVRGGNIKHSAQVDEVFLRRCPLGCCAAHPLESELGRRHPHADDLLPTSARTVPRPSQSTQPTRFLWPEQLDRL